MAEEGLSQDDLMQKVNQILVKSLQGQDITIEDKKFINSIDFPTPHLKNYINAKFDKTSGENLSAEQEKLISDFEENLKRNIERQQQQQNDEIPHDTIADARKREEIHRVTRGLRENNKSFLQLTDTHVDAPSLERILMNTKANHGISISGKLGEGYAVLHGGDMLPDFFTGTYDVTAFMMIKKGKLTGADKDDFFEIHNYMLNKIGVDNRALESGQIDPKIISSLMALYGGEYEPEGLTKKELINFRKKREKGKELLKKIFYQYAVHEYKKQRKIYEKHVNLESMLVIQGNHDHRKAFEEVFGDVALRPGEKRTIHGVTYGNSISGSTGNFLGTNEDMGFGYNDITSQLNQIIFETKSFKDFYNVVNGSKEQGGRELNIDKYDLLRTFERAKEKAKLGFQDAYVDFMNNDVLMKMDMTVSDMIGKIPAKVPDDVDVFFGHGNPTGQFAGIEEDALNKILMKLTEKKGDIIYTHGHDHSDTTHALRGSDKGNIYYLNPGPGYAGHSSRVFLDENNKYVSSLVIKKDKDGRLDYDLYDKESMPPQEYRKAA